MTDKNPITLDDIIKMDDVDDQLEPQPLVPKKTPASTLVPPNQNKSLNKPEEIIVDLKKIPKNVLEMIESDEPLESNK